MASIERYCVMGNPVAHSKSPAIHAAFARQTGARMHYEACLVEHGAFAEAVYAFRAAGGRGANVTVPFKEAAFELSDRTGERAAAAGAVNTLRFEPDGAIYGDNTDGTGFVRDFTVNLGGVIAGRRVLVLGAGGAVRGVVPAIVAEGPAALVIANRTVARARAIAASTGDERVAARGYDALGTEPYDVVVNGTSLGLSGRRAPVPDAVLGPGSWCYDLAYGEAATAFADWARARGAHRVADGLGMLVEQAAESFLVWRGVRPATEPVIAMLRGGHSTSRR